MINYSKFKLQNGLTVIHHLDESTKLCVLNVLYNVGSKHENPEKTGFAHLFEHLMFGGSANVTDFDGELQKAGGESNAFTSNDLTNYYLTLPANNIETGFWLESDRMLGLNLDQEKLDIQRSVVIEEYKERYLNQPYGDIWLKVLPLAYKVHPYSWPTIGKELSHIEGATIEDVKEFFGRFYCPNNAILAVSGNISFDDCKRLCEKWFADIPQRQFNPVTILKEPKQLAPRQETVYADVPLDAIVKAYHIPARTDGAFYSLDFISDLLGAGKSSRFFNELVKKQNLFSELDVYISGDVEEGLLVIEGRLTKCVNMLDAEKSILNELERFKLEGVSADELQKVKNKTETNIRFNNMTALSKAMKLSYCELLGNIELANTEAEDYLAVSAEDIALSATTLLIENNCSTLYYYSKQK